MILHRNQGKRPYAWSQGTSVSMCGLNPTLLNNTSQDAQQVKALSHILGTGALGTLPFSSAAAAFALQERPGGCAELREHASKCNWAMESRWELQLGYGNTPGTATGLHLVMREHAQGCEGAPV